MAVLERWVVGLFEMGLNPGLSGHKAPPWTQVFAPSFPRMGHPLRVLHAATVLGCPVLVVLSHAPAMLVWDPEDWLRVHVGSPVGQHPTSHMAPQWEGAVGDPQGGGSRTRGLCGAALKSLVLPSTLPAILDEAAV